MKICKVTSTPIRKEQSHKAEMVSQLLFGEAVEIIEEHGEWCKIKCCYDNYEGWIELKFLNDIANVNIKNEIVLSELVCIWDETSQAKHYLLPGSVIRKNSDDEYILGNANIISGELPINKKTDLKSLAFSFLNTPYLWGGKSLFGIDCSGFVQTVFKIMGIKLPRDAYQQAELGCTINVGDVQLGDLAFFENAEKKITHVGLCLGDAKIIHASGWVRIDNLDDKGIFVVDENKYSHQLKLIKRVLKI